MAFERGGRGDFAIEHDPRVLRYARQANRNYPEIELRDADVLDARNLTGTDYVFANHLLHHLSNEQCRTLLRVLDRAAPRAYLLSDLLRSKTAYQWYAGFAPFLFRQSFVVPDGLASIRRAFTVAEANALIQDAALQHPATVGTRFPGRLVIASGANPRP